MLALKYIFMISSSYPQFFQQPQWSLQNQVATRHTIDFAGVCVTGHRRNDSHTVDDAGPHGEASQEPDDGDQHD